MSKKKVKKMNKKINMLYLLGLYADISIYLFNFLTNTYKHDYVFSCSS